MKAAVLEFVFAMLGAILFFLSDNFNMTVACLAIGIIGVPLKYFIRRK